MTRIYIAGPMTGLPEFNYPAFRAAEVELGALGYATENPADNDDGTGTQTYTDYLRAALAQVIRCDGLALLDGWEASTGALLEKHVAEALGMDVLPIAAWLDRTRLGAADGPHIPTL